MNALKATITIAWIILAVYWLATAVGVKPGRGSWRRIPITGLTTLWVVLLLDVFQGGSLAVHSLVLAATGAVVSACGIVLTIWARIQLGRNWGMPMTQKTDPELVTSGPYRVVRHPIYTGLLLALLGTALVTNLIGLIMVVILAGCFYYSASQEEHNLTATFPEAYPAYRANTKMLIPFVL